MPMLVVTSLVVAPDAPTFNLKLDPGELRVIRGSHPEVGRGLALLRRPAGGQIVFEGQDLMRLGEGALRKTRRRLQYVGGDPRKALLPRQTAAQALSEPLLIHKIGRADDVRGRIEAAATALAIPIAALDREIAALSAVLRWRLLIARSLALAPALLIVDSPRAHLSAALIDGLRESSAAARGESALLWLDALVDHGADESQVGAG